MTDDRRPTALGCYIFAGGFTLGVREHFRVLTHFEDGPYGVETAVRNGLIDFAFVDPASWPADDYRGRVDFVYSNPPCAPWSRASEGRETPWQDDPRLDCVRRAFSLVESIRPRVWAWESVRRAWTHGRPLVEAVARRGAELGYSCTVLLVEGSRHGVPQVRARLFVVLHRDAIEWEPAGARRAVTVGDALSKKFKERTLEEAPERYIDLLRRMAPGEIDIRQTFDRLYAERIGAGERVRGRPSFMNRRLRADRPSLVLTGSAKLFHPTEDRHISVEESAALCGYPPSFRFHGTVGKRYAQVAQAVMPPVGEYLARMVARSLGGPRPRRSQPPLFRTAEVLADRVVTVDQRFETDASMRLSMTVEG